MRLPALLCAPAILLSVPAVRGANAPPPPAMRIEYIVRGPDTEDCPDAHVFRDTVVMGSQRDPFDVNADAPLRVTIFHTGAGYQASIEVRDPKGSMVWGKKVAPRSRCETLMYDAVIAVDHWLRDNYPPAEAPPVPQLVRLEYTRGSPTCPTEQTFQDAIGPNMTYDPIRKNATPRLIVTLRPVRRAFRGTAKVVNSAGKELWSTSSVMVLCHDAAVNLVLAIRWGLEPILPIHAPKPPPSSPPPPSRVAPAKVEAAPLGLFEPVRLNLGLGGAFAIRTVTPLFGFNLVGDAGFRWRSFSAELEFRWTPSQKTGVNSTRDKWVSVQQFSEGIVPCGHFRAFLFCGVGQVMEVVGKGSPGLMLSPSTLVSAAIGARVGADVPWPWWGWGQRFALRASIDVLGTLYNAAFSLVDKKAPTWTTSGLTVAVGLGVRTDLRLK